MKVIKASDPFVVFQGAMTRVCGTFPGVHKAAADFTLLNSLCQTVNMTELPNKTLLMYTNPSIDTPIAANVLRLLEAKSAPWQKTTLISVSEDLPFALNRFAKWEGLSRVQLLSSYRSSFGEDYGVKLTEGVLQGLLAPALLIIEQGRIVYAERMLTLTDEPNYDILSQYCR